MIVYITKLKELLFYRGIKQDWLSTQVGIHPTTMSKLVTGSTLPNLRTAQKIAKVLGVTVDDLWPLEDETTPDQ